MDIFGWIGDLLSDDNDGDDDCNSEDKDIENGEEHNELFNAIGEGFKYLATKTEELISEISGTQSSHQQGKDFEEYTEQKLEEAGLNATIVRGAGGSYWSDKYNQSTQVDIEIADNNDELIAIVECKSGGGSTNQQFERLHDLADEHGVKFILATPDGGLDSLQIKDVEILKQNETYLINPDNLYETDESEGQGIHKGLPRGFLDSSNSQPEHLENSFDDEEDSFGDEEDIEDNDDDFSDSFW